MQQRFIPHSYWVRRCISQAAQPCPSCINSTMKVSARIPRGVARSSVDITTPLSIVRLIIAWHFNTWYSMAQGLLQHTRSAHSVSTLRSLPRYDVQQRSTTVIQLEDILVRLSALLHIVRKPWVGRGSHQYISPPICIIVSDYLVGGRLWIQSLKRRKVI